MRPECKDYNIEATNYIGVFVGYDCGQYWLYDDMGGEKWIGAFRPTQDQIDQYAKTCIA